MLAKDGDVGSYSSDTVDSVRDPGAYAVDPESQGGEPEPSFGVGGEYSGDLGAGRGKHAGKGWRCRFIFLRYSRWRRGSCGVRGSSNF